MPHHHFSKIFWINIFSFFIAIHHGVVIYSASVFLDSVIHKNNIWIIYCIGAFLAIALNFALAKILKKINFSKILLYTGTLAIINLLCLTFFQSPFSVIWGFAFYLTLSAFLFLLSSVLLEDFSKQNNVGTLRGYYQTSLNCGYLLSPFISSFLITNYGMHSVFFISAIFTSFAILAFFYHIHPIPEIVLNKVTIGSNLRRVLQNKDLLYINIVDIGIKTFFTSVIVYMPFKMLEVGVPLNIYLSVLLPIALLPFLIIPNRLGHLEDRVKNEKEILQFSLLGLIFFMLVFAFLDSNSLIIWAIVLFISRSFASAADLSASSYLFKKIKVTDTTLISFFDSSQYISYLVFSPIFAILLWTGDIKLIFLSVSLLLCFMLVLVSKLHDTKNYEKHQVWKDIWSKSKRRSQKGAA